MEGNPLPLMAFDHIGEFNHTCEEVMSVKDTGTTSQAEAMPLGARTQPPSSHSARPSHRSATNPSRPMLLFAGLATSGVLAAASLLTSAALIRLTMGPDPGILAIVILSSATLTATLTGTWFAQPLVTRLILGASRSR